MAIPAVPAAGEISKALNPVELIGELNEVNYSRLKAVLAQMRSKVDLRAHALAELQRDLPVKRTAKKKRTEAQQAFDQVKFREQVSRLCISEAGLARAVAAAESVARTAAE